MGINQIIQIGTRIKMLRKSKGISQREMANLCDIPVTTYSNYENNNREPSVDNLEKIANTLEVPLADLLGISHLSPNEQFNIIADTIESDTDTEFTNAWDNFLISNNIHFMSSEKDGVSGMLLTFTDTNESYFLTMEQAESLPKLSIEQIKLLIKAMGKAAEDE
ncbi:MAG: helix-turn-helix transcriptional regulator [Clostridiales bacterium]|nr:helix-turn-helix transcriptional regulator [Clostridiales bacterium]